MSESSSSASTPSPSMKPKTGSPRRMGMSAKEVRHAKTGKRKTSTPIKPLFRAKPTSRETVFEYIFREAVLFSAISSNSKIRLNEEDLIRLGEEAPLIRALWMKKGVSFVEIIRISHLSHFIKREQAKALSIAGSTPNDDGLRPDALSVEQIPVPPIVPDISFGLCESAIKMSKSSTTDEQIENMRKGYELFREAFNILKNKLYPSLFTYLMSDSFSSGHGGKGYDKIRETYYLFLEHIISPEHIESLSFFCSVCDINPAISKIEKRIYGKGTGLESTGDNNSPATQSIFKEIDNILTENRIVLSRARLPDHLSAHDAHLPALFFSDYSYFKGELLSTSLSSILLDVIPVLEKSRYANGDTGDNASQAEAVSLSRSNDANLDDDYYELFPRESWHATTGATELQLFLLYKAYKALSIGDKMMKAQLDLDKQAHLSIVEAGIDNIAKDATDRASALKRTNGIIQIIKRQNIIFASSLEREVVRKARFLFEAEYFKKQNETDRIVSMINIVRMSFAEKKSLLPKITEDFYLDIQNRELKKTIISSVKKIMELYEEGIKDGSIASVKKKAENNNALNAQKDKGHDDESSGKAKAPTTLPPENDSKNRDNDKDDDGFNYRESDNESSGDEEEDGIGNVTEIAKKFFDDKFLQ